MRRRPWERLVRELRAEGIESPYLERLRQRVDPGLAQEDLEKEIAHEMASALGRAEEKLLVALLELERGGRAHDAARDAEERAALAEAFDRLRERALAARHELLVHREAIGIRRNAILETMYPIPPRRVAPASPPSTTPASWVRVVIKLRFASDVAGDAARAGEARSARIAVARDRLLASLPPDGVRATRWYATLPWLALAVAPSALEIVRASPLVEVVEPDRLESIAAGRASESVSAASEEGDAAVPHPLRR